MRGYVFKPSPPKTIAIDGKVPINFDTIAQNVDRLLVGHGHSESDIISINMMTMPGDPIPAFIVWARGMGHPDNVPNPKAEAVEQQPESKPEANQDAKDADAQEAAGADSPEGEEKAAE